MTKQQVSIQTSRLLLRPFDKSDAPALQQLAGNIAIADTMISIPHPYSLHHAISWLDTHRQDFQQGLAVRFAISRLSQGMLVGAVELRDLDNEHSQAELSFWLGKDWWGYGYSTEAAAPVVRFGFETLGLNRIYAHHMVRNPASGRVLQKLGMRLEGLMRQRVRKWGQFEDVMLYAIQRDDLVQG